MSKRQQPPRRGDDSPVAPEDSEGLALLEDAMDAVGVRYVADWLAHLTPDERASYEAEIARLRGEESADSSADTEESADE